MISGLDWAGSLATQWPRDLPKGHAQGPARPLLAAAPRLTWGGPVRIDGVRDLTTENCDYL